MFCAQHLWCWGKTRLESSIKKFNPPLCFQVHEKAGNAKIRKGKAALAASEPGYTPAAVLAEGVRRCQAAQKLGLVVCLCNCEQAAGCSTGVTGTGSGEQMQGDTVPPHTSTTASVAGCWCGLYDSICELLVTMPEHTLFA